MPETTKASLQNFRQQYLKIENSKSYEGNKEEKTISPVVYWLYAHFGLRARLEAQVNFVQNVPVYKNYEKHFKTTNTVKRTTFLDPSTIIQESAEFKL